jgi:transcription antitermination factor NusG
VSAAVNEVNAYTLSAIAPESSEYPWYAVRTRSNCEQTVSEVLKQKGLTEFSPFYVARRRWSDRTKRVRLPLFPGYLFCRFDPLDRLPVLRTPGVVNIVGLRRSRELTHLCFPKLTQAF